MSIMGAFRTRRARRQAERRAFNDECCKFDRENPSYLDQLDSPGGFVFTQEACDRLLAVVHSAELEEAKAQVEASRPRRLRRV